MAEEFLRMRGISKSYPGVNALDGVSFDVGKAICHLLFVICQRRSKGVNDIYARTEFEHAAQYPSQNYFAHGEFDRRTVVR
jgi:hypothetical protein